MGNPRNSTKAWLVTSAFPFESQITLVIQMIFFPKEKRQFPVQFCYFIITRTCLHLVPFFFF